MLRSGLFLRAGRLLIPAVLLLVVRASPADPSRGERAPRLPGFLEDIRTLAPAPQGIAVAGKSGRIGHLDLFFEKGVLFPLRSRAGVPLGFLFEGRGRFVYRSEESADREAMLLKIAQLAPGLAGAGGQAEGMLDRLFLLFAAPAFQDLLEPVAGGGAPVPLDPRARGDFERIWAGFQEAGVGFDHLCAEARLNREAGQGIQARMEGLRRALTYTFDTLRDSRESLALIRKSPATGRPGAEALSRQSIPGERGVRLGPLFLREIRIEVDARHRPEGTIVSELGLEAAREGVRVAAFHLMNHRRLLEEGWSYPGERLRILRLTDGKGRELPFSHRYHELLVELAEPLAWGDTLRLKVETAGEVFGPPGKEPAEGTFFLAGIPWHPLPTGWSADGFTFTLRVRTKKPFRPVATGREMALREDGDEYDLRTESLVPVRRLALAAGDFRILEERSGGHAVLFTSAEAISPDLPRLSRDLLGFLEGLLGPYPYDDLRIVQVPVRGFGAALPGMVLIPGSSFKPAADAYARYFSRPLPRRLAHEIARQWFGQKVFPASPKDAWLSDSVAEYLSAVAVAGLAPAAGHDSVFRGALEEWGWEAGGCRNGGSLAAAGYMEGDATGQSRFCLLFNRGPRVLQILRLAVGEDRFFSILRRLLAEAPLDLADTEALRKIAEEESRADLGWFFEDWIERGGIPEIQVITEVDPAGEGRFALTGRAIQTPGPAFRRIPIPIVLEYPGGGIETRILFQDSPDTPFRFDLPERPKRISVDPGHESLALFR